MIYILLCIFSAFTSMYISHHINDKYKFYYKLKEKIVYISITIIIIYIFIITIGYFDQSSIAHTFSLVFFYKYNFKYENITYIIIYSTLHFIVITSISIFLLIRFNTITYKRNNSSQKIVKVFIGYPFFIAMICASDLIIFVFLTDGVIGLRGMPVQGVLSGILILVVFLFRDGVMSLMLLDIFTGVRAAFINRKL